MYSHDVFELVKMKEISALILDFDNSVCIHNNHSGFVPNTTREFIRFSNCIKDKNYYINNYSDGVDFEPLPGMKELILFCNENSIPVILLSYSTCTIYLDAKKEYMEFVFGKDSVSRVIGVSSNNEKVHFLELYLKYIKLGKRKSIAFVDDVLDIRKGAAQLEGCFVFSPMNVSVAFEKYKRRLN